MTYNCLDRHIGKRGNQTAIIHDSSMTGQVTRLTYRELLKEVKLLANVLKEKYHVQQGDVVLIYMPMIPQAIVSMLACARLGAIHTLVFGGFSANELAVRIKHSQPKLLISGKRTTGGKRRALPFIRTVVFSQRGIRTATNAQLQNDRRRSDRQKRRG